MSASDLTLSFSPESASEQRQQPFSFNEALSSSEPLSPPIEAVVKRLSSRLTEFENNLNNVVKEEQEFRIAFKEQTDSLHALVQRYAREDENIRRLVEEDTQRSRDAQAEYEALQRDFDEQVRPNSPTRIRKWLSTVWTNVWIVLSLVFMAPVHAIWVIVEKLLTETGLVGHGNDSIHRSYSTFSNREDTPMRVDNEIRRKRRALKAEPLKDGQVVTHWLQKDEPKLESRRKKLTLDNLSTTPKDEASLSSSYTGMHTVTSPPTSLLPQSSIQETPPTLVSTVNRVDDQILPGSEPNETSQPNESDDVFVDAQGETSPVPQKPRLPIAQQDHVEEEEISSPDVTEVTSDPGSQRPAWARVGESNQTLPDIAQFPSGEFWDISDDEMKLELRR